MSLPKNLIWFFLHFLKVERLAILIACLCPIALAVDHIFWALISQKVIDALALLEDRAEMWVAIRWPVVFGIGLAVGVETGMRLGGLALARLCPRLEAAIRMAFFDELTVRSYRYFTDQLAGTIASRIDALTSAFTRIVRSFLLDFSPVCLSIAMGTILFARMQPIFALLLLGWAVVHIAISIIFAGRCQRSAECAAAARSRLSGIIVDVITNMINVKLFSSVWFERKQLYQLQEDEQEKHRRAYIDIEWMRFAMGVAYLAFPFFAINWYILHTWQKGEITTGDLVFIFYSMWGIIMGLWNAGNVLPDLYRDLGICRQAITLFEDDPEVQDVLKATQLRVEKGEICFDEVSFHYGKENGIFHKKSVIIHPKEKIGLVGFSGAGKTTFVNLILRLFDVTGGRILIDGTDLRQVTQASLREQIAVIPQDPLLFHRSLLDNIRYGRLTASDEEVMVAAERAHCDEFIRMLPEGYATLVGERGVKLSGGQRQRIAIARALLKDAPILILDEATSMLDSITERYIQEGVNSLMAQRTVIIIAHRLSTLATMDRILVFKGGSIVEEGTHDTLLVMRGHYAHMWAMQAGGFLPDRALEN